jgi:hypothetical protein
MRSKGAGEKGEGGRKVSVGKKVGEKGVRNLFPARGERCQVPFRVREKGVRNV